MAPTSDYWVFAYGSLMWNPGFPYREVHTAVVHGYHRAFCLYSHHYRGTEEIPGLVLGLDRGGSCTGRAYGIAPAKADEVRAYLHEREMLHYVYDPKDVLARLPDGRKVRAHTYVVVRDSGRYAGKLTLEQSARFILQGVGISGANLEYLQSTVRHLDELGIADRPTRELWALVRRRARADGG